MIRLLARIAIILLANAVGLVMARMFVDGFSIDGIAFVTAVVVFTLATTVLGPLVAKIALTNAPYLMGGIALVTTFVGLVITNILSDGISISGVSAWIISTLVVWICSVIGSVVLPLVLLKKVLSADKTK
jgi:putative membrane protein